MWMSSSPLLFFLYTNSCTSSHQSVRLKFMDDTTLTGLRMEMSLPTGGRVTIWGGQNNSELNALKTVEILGEMQPHQPLYGLL